MTVPSVNDDLARVREMLQVIADDRRLMSAAGMPVQYRRAYNATEDALAALARVETELARLALTLNPPIIEGLSDHAAAFEQWSQGGGSHLAEWSITRGDAAYVFAHLRGRIARAEAEVARLQDGLRRGVEVASQYMDTERGDLDGWIDQARSLLSAQPNQQEQA